MPQEMQVAVSPIVPAVAVESDAKSAASSSDASDPLQVNTAAGGVPTRSPSAPLSPTSDSDNSVGSPSTVDSDLSESLSLASLTISENKTTPPAKKPQRIDRLETLLKHAHPQTMFIFDIDETLVMTPFSARIFNSENIATFESHINALAIDEEYKKMICDRVQEMLDKKVLVEEDITTQVVTKLQDMGCWVFGLTSRYCTTAIRTHEMLKGLGIDLTRASPLPPDLSLQDPGTQAVYSHGIIYTNAMDKGYVLNRFMENVLLREYLDAQQNDSSRPAGSTAPISINRNSSFREGEEYTLDTSGIRVPSEIVFVDDRLSNSESVLEGMPLAAKLGIPVHSYHYVAAKAEDEEEEEWKPEAISRCIRLVFDAIFPVPSTSDSSLEVSPLSI